MLAYGEIQARNWSVSAVLIFEPLGKTIQQNALALSADAEKRQYLILAWLKRRPQHIFKQVQFGFPAHKQLILGLRRS
ncbi:hypothetical protein D3C76_1011680 [compost metagenome]|jgi:hypothetical protein